MKRKLERFIAEGTPGELTLLLPRFGVDADVTDQLIRNTYSEVRRIARRHLQREKPHQTLQSMDIAQQAYLKLISCTGAPFQNSRHFFGASENAVKQILIDHGRSRAAQKRFHEETPLNEAQLRSEETAEGLLIVRQALDRLHAINPLWRRLMRLRILKGLTAKEIAEKLGMGESTVRRELAAAGTWMRRDWTIVNRASLVGQTVSHYRLLEKLGSGPTATVYRAMDTRLQRTVAVKVLDPVMFSDPEIRRRFDQEARCASALNDPHIVTVHDIDSFNDLDFIVMEYIAGPTLDAVIPKSGLPANTALNYGLQLACALAKAHASKIIHRDLKPSNILITNGGLLKLVDFGLAKALSFSERDSSKSPKTHQGTILGTAGYMAPEQVRGEAADHRADIFSFGALMYEMLTGRPAFREASSIETLNAILKTVPDKLPSAVPPGLARIVRRCLEKSPDKRYQRLQALITDLLRARRTVS